MAIWNHLHLCTVDMQLAPAGGHLMNHVVKGQAVNGLYCLPVGHKFKAQVTVALTLGQSRAWYTDQQEGQVTF